MDQQATAPPPGSRRGLSGEIPREEQIQAGKDEEENRQLLHSERHPQRVLRDHRPSIRLFPSLRFLWVSQPPHSSLQPGNPRIIFSAWLPTSKLTPKLERVIVSKVMNPDPNAFKFLDACSFILTIFDVCLKYDYSIGDVVFLDLRDFSMAHVLKVDPNLMMKFLQIYQEASCGRLIGVHIINAPSCVEVLMKIIQSVAPPKLFNKVSLPSLFSYSQPRCAFMEFFVVSNSGLSF